MFKYLIIFSILSTCLQAKTRIFSDFEVIDEDPAKYLETYLQTTAPHVAVDIIQNRLQNLSTEQATTFLTSVDVVILCIDGFQKWDAPFFVKLKEYANNGGTVIFAGEYPWGFSSEFVGTKVGSLVESFVGSQTFTKTSEAGALFGSNPESYTANCEAYDECMSIGYNQKALTKWRVVYANDSGFSMMDEIGGAGLLTADIGAGHAFLFAYDFRYDSNTTPFWYDLVRSIAR